MDISINTPALLFPAISLVMLAYTNRYLAIATLARRLHDHQLQDNPERIRAQIRILRYRLRLVRQMQLFGVLSFLIALGSMYFIYSGNMDAAHFTFAASMIAFVVSLVLSLIEIWKSIESVELHLSDISEGDGESIVDVLKDKIKL